MINYVIILFIRGYTLNIRVFIIHIRGCHSIRGYTLIQNNSHAVEI